MSKNIVCKYSDRLLDATVYNDQGNLELAQDFRSCKSASIEYDDEPLLLFTIYQTVAEQVQDIRYTKLNRLNLLCYSDEGDHYDWHTDNGSPEVSNRCYTLVWNLTEPSEYNGCELQIQEANSICIPEKDTDRLTVFDSSLKHRVTKLTSGVRYSIVGWFLK